MQDSGMVTIAGRMLTIGGHQIETITTATRHNAGRSTSSTRPSRSRWIDTSEPAQSPHAPVKQGFRYLRRRNFGLVSAGLAMYGAVGASGAA
jgi:hypothetical protein